MNKPAKPQALSQIRSVSTSAAQKLNQPVAPPVYRPQPTPTVLQRKTIENHRFESTQGRPRPVAPPVYSPQPTPKVLQTKKSAFQSVNQTTHSQRSHTPVQLKAARPVASTRLSSKRARESAHKGGQVIQPMLLGSCRVTVHRKHQSAVGVRGVIQQKPLRITVNSNMLSKKDLTIEVDEDGTITGTALRQQVINGYVPQLLGKAAYVTVKSADGPIANDGTRYTPLEYSTFTLHYDELRSQADERDREEVDKKLIKLAKSADVCIIGCFLLGRPGDPGELDRQQYLGGILKAIRANQKLTVVLIDPNFKKLPPDGQVVDYLQTYEKVQLNSQSEDGITSHTVTRYAGTPVTAQIEIIYVGRFVNKPTEAKMKKRNIGHWYCD